MPEGEIQAPPMLDAAVAFGRVLRGAGLRVGTDRLVEFARAVEEMDPSRRDDVYWSGRITLTSRPEDIEIYDRAFELFWETGGGAKPTVTPEGTPLRAAARPLRHAPQEDRREERIRRGGRQAPLQPGRGAASQGLRPLLAGGVRRAPTPAGRPADSPGRSERAGAWNPLRADDTTPAARFGARCGPAARP